MSPKSAGMTVAGCRRVLGGLLLSDSGSEDMVFREVTNHSGKVCPGALFVAISGSRFDGHEYIPAAVASGAMGVVHQFELPEYCPEISYFRVSDAYEAYARLVEYRFNFPARNLTLVGITGTNGKTSTVYLLSTILVEAGLKCGKLTTVSQTFGKHVIPTSRTTPEAWEVQRLFADIRDAGCSHVIMEVSSHALDQRRIGTAKFAAAAFTNLTGDHLDYHRDMESYYLAKRRLFMEHLAENAIVAVNVDDVFGERLSAESIPGTVLRIGRNAGVDCRIGEISLSRTGMNFDLELNGRGLHIDSPLIGLHNAYNLATAVVLAGGLGIAPETIISALGRSISIPGRLEAFHTDAGFSIYVDYAHTDDALEHVLKTLRSLGSSGKLTVIFGCGGDRDRSKRSRMGAVAAKFADRIILTSDNPRNEDPLKILHEIQHGIPDDANFKVIADRRKAIRETIAEAVSGDIVLIAGKGHENYQEINGERYPFDDRQEIITNCGERGIGLVIGSSG